MCLTNNNGDQRVRVVWLRFGLAARVRPLSVLPMLAVMVMVSTAGLSLMVLDMNMRVGRM